MLASLLEISSDSDPLGVEETRMRAATFLGKVKNKAIFHIHVFYFISNPAFDFIGKLLKNSLKSRRKVAKQLLNIKAIIFEYLPVSLP